MTRCEPPAVLRGGQYRLEHTERGPVATLTVFPSVTIPDTATLDDVIYDLRDYVFDVVHSGRPLRQAPMLVALLRVLETDERDLRLLGQLGAGVLDW